MAGGLKLTLEAANSRDRRVRFAEVSIRRLTDGEPTTLVTDAAGRMRYRLSYGDYRLSMSGGPTRGLQRDRKPLDQRAYTHGLGESWPVARSCR